MSLRPVASLAVKLLGLYAIINALPVLSLVVLAFTRDMFMSPAQTWTAALWNASGGALQMGIGIALWWFSEGIAALMVRGDEKAPDEPVEWQTLAFSTLGLYLCTDSTAHLLRVAGVLLLTNYRRTCCGQVPTTSVWRCAKPFQFCCAGCWVCGSCWACAESCAG